MVRWFMMMVVFAAGLLIWSGIGSAETVQGRIVEIDPNQKSLTLNRMDSATGQPEQLRLMVDDNTSFQGGIASLASLKVGEEISVEADQNFVTRQWKANSIQPASATQGRAQPAAGSMQVGAEAGASKSASTGPAGGNY